MVRADNRFSEKSALHIPNDYMTYGGIIRPIVLEEVRAAYIQYVHVTPYRANGKMECQGYSEAKECIFRKILFQRKRSALILLWNWQD